MTRNIGWFWPRWSCVFTAAVSLAQQTTTSTETKTFEVLAVSGNTLDVRLPEGTRELTVPDDFRFTVNGQQLSVHEMKPGMKGTATITTKTTVTPVTVTEVKNGTVMQCVRRDPHRADPRRRQDVHPRRHRQARHEDDAGRQARAVVGLPCRRSTERDDHHDRAAEGHDPAASERHPREGRRSASGASGAPAASRSSSGSAAPAAVDSGSAAIRRGTPRNCRRRPASGRCSHSPASCRSRRGSR